MTKKPDLTNITTMYNAAGTISENNDKIEASFENTLSRDGSTPNNMQADLDMDGNDIINVGSVTIGGVGIDAEVASLDVTNNITVGGTVDGRDVAADGTKLDGLDQGVATTDSPSFAALTVNGELEVTDGSVPIITLTDNGGGKAVVASFNGQLILNADSDSTQGAAPIIFRSTGVTETMRVDVGGNLVVGNTTALVGGENTNSGATIYPAGAIVVANGLSAANLNLNKVGAVDGEAIRFLRNGVDVGSVDISAGATAYNTSSDYRLKENVVPLEDAADRLLALKPSRFNFIGEAQTIDGFLAHEAQEVVPNAVTGVKDGEETQGIDHSKLVPLLTAALQEALGRIAVLEEKVNE